MSKLEKRAREAAYAVIDAVGKTDRNIDKQDIADAIVEVARVFAGHVAGELVVRMGVCESSHFARQEYGGVIAEAVAAAERDG